MSERFMKNLNGEKVFSLEYDKETLRDMVIEKQEQIERLNNIINKAIEYIEKYLQEHVIDEYPDEQSTFYDEEDRFIPNAKEQLLDILQGKEK